MVLFNYAIREITAKIVYYGPGLCGKTTNLQFIHEKLDPSARGKLLSLATDGDRTLFFDFLPIEMGSIGGYKVRFQLYTVPGQVHYNATRKLVLKGVDAVAFVADSQVSMIERNRESFENLCENLAENGYELARVPVVIQLNKRDLPNVASVGELVAAMDVVGYPVLEAVASSGEGVFETLKTVIKLTLARLRTQFDAEAGGGVERREAPPPPPPPPPPRSVFAPAPPVTMARPEPVLVAAAPPPVPEAAPSPAVENIDEFDLEDFGEASVATPVMDLEPEHEIHVKNEEPGAPGGLDPDDTRRAFFEEMDRDLPAPAAVETLPAWALQLRDELQSLREENHELRAALRCFADLVDRQIDVLREGRELIDRRLHDKPGGEAT